MHLIHWSNDPLTSIGSRTQPLWRDKPIGLWVSDESEFGWSQWCGTEQFRRGKNAYEVVLDPSADILFIRDAETLLAFTEKFQYTHPQFPSTMSMWINWAEVAKHWQGIIITPYLGSMRLHQSVFWYYTWDCASGCIWDPTAILDVKDLQAVHA